MYYKFINDIGQMSIIKMPEEMWIPIAEGNTDYQQFLTYLSDNNLTIDDIPMWEP